MAALSHAAFPNGTTWEVRSNGSNSNGGGFVTGSAGTDYSQQNSAQYGFTTLASSNGNTTPCIVSDTNHSFVTADVGNFLQISGGTNWLQNFYEIVSVSGGAATLDRACGSSASLTSGTYKVGGALNTLAQLNTVMGITNNIQQVAWVKNDATYSVSGQAAAFSFTVNGCTNCEPVIQGYTTSRGDNGMPTIQASASISNSIIEIAANNSLVGLTFKNFIIDCNSKSNTYGLQINSYGNSAINVKVTNCTNDGIRVESGSDMCMQCYVTGTTSGTAAIDFDGNNSAPYEPALCIECVATGNSITGIRLINSMCFHCISANNTGANTDGFGLNTSGSGPSWLFQSVAYNNGRDGVLLSNGSSQTYVLRGNIFVLNGNYGLVAATAVNVSQIFEDYNFYYGNTTAATANLVAGSHDVTGTGDPFVSGSGNNFALNSTTGAGAAAYAASFPGALLLGGTGYLDIGALQHQQTGGGATIHAYPIIQ